MPDVDFKDDADDDNAQHTLDGLQRKQVRIKKLHAAKADKLRIQREQEKKEWLKMMQGDRNYDDMPVETKPPFDPYQFKIIVLGQIIAKLEEEEKKLQAPGADTSIVVRKDIGVTKKINDKADSIIQ